jgi:AraC-like DNA-binding protein
MTSEARLRLQTVILAMPEPVPHHSFDIPLPRSDDLLAVAHERCLHPCALSRRFAAETGHTFTQWRILARMHLAVQRLVGGGTVVSAMSSRDRIRRATADTRGDAGIRRSTTVPGTDVSGSTTTTASGSVVASVQECSRGTSKRTVVSRRPVTVPVT